MASTGAIGIKNAGSVEDTGTVFVGLYLILFASILFIYELAQVCPCSALDNLWKRNFGFLYGPNGKGLYMCFISILSFGLSNPYDLALATGFCVGFFGILIMVLAWKYPENFDKKEKYVP